MWAILQPESPTQQHTAHQIRGNCGMDEKSRSEQREIELDNFSQFISAHILTSFVCKH